MPLRHFSILFALVALLSPLALHLASAQSRHVTDIEEKHKLIKQRRPDEKNVRGAKDVLRDYEGRQVAVFNAMRILGRGDIRLSQDPYIHGRLPIPPLGVLTGNAESQPDTWVLLRLLALLRAGYPAGTDLCTEISEWMNSGAPARKHVWADVSLELLALDALLEREDKLLEASKEKARARGQEIASRRDWDLVAHEEPSIEQMTKLYHVLLARRIAIKHGWAENPAMEEASAAVEELAGALRKHRDPVKELWIDVPEEVDAVYYRALLLMGAILHLAAEDKGLDKGARTDAEKSAVYIEARLPAELDAEDAWRVTQGDALALYLAGGEKFGPYPKAVRKDLERLALSDYRLCWALPRPKNSHIAPQFGWVLSKSYGDPGMGRAEMSTEERDQVAAICLSLLATAGGLQLESEPREPLGWGEGVKVFTALETLDLDDYYGYMLTTDLAIDAAAGYLLSRQNSKGYFMKGGYNEMLGGHGLAVHALLDAGVSRDDTKMKKAFEIMVDQVEEMVKPHTFGSFGQQNYCCDIAMMAFQSYYEPEIRASGMYEACHPEEYAAAQAKVWSKIDPRHRAIIAEISWRLSNADGYGWGYSLPEEHRPRPAPITTTPQDKKPEDKGESPTTGKKAEEKNGKVPQEIQDERRRRSREGKFPDRLKSPPQGWRHADGSNSQYAVLGIKAGMLLGAPIDYNTLAWDAMRLIDCFKPSGYAERLIDPTQMMTLEQLEKRSRDPRYADDSDPNQRRARPDLQLFQVGGWSYFAGSGNTWGAAENIEKKGGGYVWPYSVGMTAAGISSLAILRDALMIAPTYDPQLIAKIDDRLAGGLIGLGNIYPYSRQYFKLDAKQSECWIGGGEGRGMLYDMYGCERAGVLTHSVYFGDIDWYRDGADLMIKLQLKEGGWESLNEQICNFSFALLFLKRSAPYLATQRPPQRTGPVTGK
ncbi:MAG: hypothetical protein H6841_10825 [Planctomycetes bacterium]|nr:hypothetical protein [Planctomycetota bacterium]MCB9936266.1 hypothetical protein [Planctomycetota bacterium]